MSSNINDHIKLLKKLQKQVLEEANKHTSNDSAKSRLIINKVRSKLVYLAQSLKENPDSKKNFLKEIITKYASTPYLTFFKNLEGKNLITKCLLDESSCIDFFKEEFDIKKISISKRLDFFSVYLDYDGWYDAKFFLKNLILFILVLL